MKSTSVLKFAFGCLSLIGSLYAQADQSTYLIQNVRVFDGEHILSKQQVLIKLGKIQDLNFKGKISADMKLIEGRGRTLLPGLMDAHVHAFKDQDLPLLYGVTTQIDMFSAVSQMQEMNKRMAQHDNFQNPDLISAGTLATAPGGHGTEYGMKIETLTAPDQAQAWVDKRIAEGSHFIKIVMEKGGSFGRFNTLDLATVKALIDAAHARHKLAVVHIGSYEDAVDALEAGADGLVHLFIGKDLSEAQISRFVQLAREKKAFVIPTFSVLESMAGVKPKEAQQDVNLMALLDTAQAQILNATYGSTEKSELLNAPMRLTAALAQAGVPILAGTDAGNNGTQFGISLQHELAVLVKAGLTPLAALRAATAAPAQAFHLDDRGRIAVGKKADLLLVEGEPDHDILATRHIVEIWKDGHAVSPLREEKLQKVREQKQKKSTGVALPENGRISDFSADKLASPFGSGWMMSSDSVVGGKSDVHWSLADQTEQGDQAILIQAKVRSGFSFPWAGLAFYAGVQPMQTADLSAANTLKFKIKGDGKNYRVAINVEGSYIPLMQTFNTTDQWQEVSIPFARFSGMDPRLITVIAFNAGPEEGDYAFQIADVRLLKE